MADHETGGLSLGRDEYDMDWSTIVEAARMDDNRTTDFGWTSSGHTGAAVPVYAAGVGAERFLGYLDNTALSRRIAAALDLPD